MFDVTNFLDGMASQEIFAIQETCNSVCSECYTGLDIEVQIWTGLLSAPDVNSTDNNQP